MKPIAISLSPNTEPDDVRIAWRVLFQPWLWRRTDIVDEVENQLSDHLNNQPVVMTSSGRSAIYHLLRTLDIGQGDEVIIQAFTCVAVPAAIQWTGAKVVYADITTTYNIDPAEVRSKITSRTKAIIVQHTFGIPGPLVEIKELTRQNNIKLIEDCAHAIGATYQGQPVGTLGDAAIFSFGRDKALSCVYGGAISSRDQMLMEKVQQQISQLKNASFIWIKQQLLHPILFNLILPLYNQAGLGKILLVALQKSGFLSKAIEPTEKHGAKPRHIDYRFPGALAYLLKLQLSKLNRYTTRRRAIANTYRAALNSEHSGNSSLYIDSSWLRWPLLVDNPTQLHFEAKQQNILLGDWYNSPIVPSDSNAETFGYQSGSCPHAENIAKQVINLPTYPRLTEQQVKQVIGLVLEYK